MNEKISKERKRKMKNSKGITLIALIITIVILLILAVVAINAVSGDGIIAHAQNAVNEYQAKADEENSLLEGYLAKIEENLPGEEILWALIDWGDEDYQLYFVGNVTELDLSQDKEVKAYVATDELEYNENSEVTTLKLSDVGIITLKEGSIQKLILGAEIYEKVDADRLNSKIVVLEEGITAIGKEKFWYSTMESIEIPSTVTSVSGSAFNGCTNLTSITIKKAEGSLNLSNSGLTEAQINSIVWAPETAQ